MHMVLATSTMHMYVQLTHMNNTTYLKLYMGLKFYAIHDVFILLCCYFVTTQLFLREGNKFISRTLLVII